MKSNDIYRYLTIRCMLSLLCNWKSSSGDSLAHFRLQKKYGQKTILEIWGIPIISYFVDMDKIMG